MKFIEVLDFKFDMKKLFYYYVDDYRCKDEYVLVKSLTLNFTGKRSDEMHLALSMDQYNKFIYDMRTS